MNTLRFLKEFFKKGEISPRWASLPNRASSLLYEQHLNQPCNYRPIFQLSLISKVPEKVIQDQISTFLDSKNLLRTYQSDFQKKNCLSVFNNKILKGIDKDVLTGMILKKTFKRPLTTIDHEEFCQKLSKKCKTCIGYSRKQMKGTKKVILKKNVCYVICNCHAVNIDVVALYLSERLNNNLYYTLEKL